MADILIRGMEMPKGDNTISITIFSNGKVSLAHDKKYAEYADAVPLPDGHGRLIDAEELRKAMYHEAFETDSHMQKWESGCWIRYRMFERNLETVSTIVPADVADNYVGSKSEEGETDDSKL